MYQGCYVRTIVKKVFGDDKINELVCANGRKRDRVPAQNCVSFTDLTHASTGILFAEGVPGVHNDDIVLIGPAEACKYL